jgi:hypothetical protein
MVIFFILIFSASITALITGHETIGMFSVILGIAILGINFLKKYLYANRKCSICGERGSLYTILGNVYYQPIINGPQEIIDVKSITCCTKCEDIEKEKQQIHYESLRVRAEAEREKEETLETLSSKTCPHCGKYNVNWDEMKRIYQIETINGALYQKYIYKRKCKYCSHNDDKISDWI